MTEQKRRSAFGPTQKKPWVPPQVVQERQFLEAQARGNLMVKEAQAALENDPASSDNRRAAEEVARQKNQPTIEAMKERFAKTGKP